MIEMRYGDTRMGSTWPGRTRGAARTRGGRRPPGALLDRLAESDPGFAATRMGVQAAGSVGLAVVLVWLARQSLFPLVPPVGPFAAAAPESTVLTLVGGVVALMTSLAVSDRGARGQTGSAVVMLFGLVAAAAAGIALTGRTVLLAIVLVVVAGGAVALRRWGPRWSALGVALFNGMFLALMMDGRLSGAALGWVAVAALAGTVAFLVVRLTLLRPDVGHLVRRLYRTWDARANRLLLLAADALTESLSPAGEEVARASLGRRRAHAVDLVETTLSLDAAHAGLGGASERADVLFELESAVIESARLAGDLAMEPAASVLRTAGRSALVSAVDRTGAATRAAAAALRAAAVEHSSPGSPDHLTGLRLADTIDWYAGARERTSAMLSDARSRPDAGPGFVSAASLQGEFLLGGARPHLVASVHRGAQDGVLGGLVLPIWARLAMQIVVATAGAILAGYALLGHIPTWGVLSIFLVFLAGMNSADQVRRGAHRIVGTGVGVLLGAGLTTLAGPRGWVVLIVVVVTIFVGVASMRVRYVLMAVATATVMAQFEYLSSGVLDWDVLVLRLAETAIGIAAFVLTVALVAPLYPRRVLATAREQWASAQRGAVDVVLSALAGAGTTPIAAAVRDADLAYVALRSVTTSAAHHAPGTGCDRTWFVDAAAGVRLYTRLLAGCAVCAHRSDDSGVAVDPDPILDRLRASVGAAERLLAAGEASLAGDPGGLADLRAARAALDGPQPGAGDREGPATSPFEN